MNLELFQNPPKEFREVPFWSWNDDLDPDELVRQIDLMDQAGWGGFFMHSRVGLKTPYLGSRWMDCIRAGVDAARQRGMGAWIYDEDKWPSGYAGGLSTAATPAFRARYLVCKVDNRPALLAERIATFSAHEIDGQLVDFRPEDHPVLKDGRDRVVQFYVLEMPLGQEPFNDYAYLDLLNPKAVQAFLQSTHQAYADAFPEELGKTIPGVFTDEPCTIFRLPGERPTFVFLPWTNGFEAYFQEQNGYDLRPHLPALFFPGVKSAPAFRYDFFRTVSKRFLESFTLQVSAWCKDHNLAYTGHYMAEDTLLEQMHWTGGVMRHYPYMDVPGIDKLWRLVNGYCGMVLTVKQLDSIVCQLGKSRALCENYGGAGPDSAHAIRKWIGDWAYVLGITLNNPHLSLYSLRGERKRDCPQNLFYQQPWWPENRLIADYFARLSYVLSQGQRVVDIVLIHPMGSAWAVFQAGSTSAIDELDDALDRLNRVLVEHQRDFHLADETLIAPGGETEAKVIASPDGPRLQVGKMAYRLVIIPSGVTLANTTVSLLQEFAKAGGPVLAVPPVPTLIDARQPVRPILPATTRLVSLDHLPVVLDELLPFDVQIPGQPNVWVHHRRIDGQDWYFLANIDQEKGTQAGMALRGTGRLEEWNPTTGEVSPLTAGVKDGITTLDLDFAPAGSHLLTLYPDEASPAIARPAEKPVQEITLADTWSLTLDGHNSATLDRVQLKIGNTPYTTWSGPMYILDAQRILASKGTGTSFALRFSIEIECEIPQPVFLAVESPEQFTISVNGTTLPLQDRGWWVDISFRKLDLGAALKVGHNEIVMEGIFRRDSELESVYLLGNFGVNLPRKGFEAHLAGQTFDRYAERFSLGLLPQSVTAAPQGPHSLALDLTASGLPFFAGRARLSQTVALPPGVEQAWLEFTRLRAAVAPVWVNGKQVGVCAWQPHRVDLSGSLAPGENRIEIELVPTLRNLLGPHHRTGGDGEGTGPSEFNNKTLWTDDTILVPLGFDGVSLFYPSI